MSTPRDEPRQNDSQELARVTQEVASKLHTRGIEVDADDSPEELVRLLDSVERFERAVSRRGGDLMVDEPPLDEIGEPDDPAFLLQTRAADESIGTYIKRLDAATLAIRTRGDDR